MSYPRRNWTAAEWQAFNEQARTLLSKPRVGGTFGTMLDREGPDHDTESREAWASLQGREARAVNRDNRKAGAK